MLWKIIVLFFPFILLAEEALEFGVVQYCNCKTITVQRTFKEDKDFYIELEKPQTLEKLNFKSLLLIKDIIKTKEKDILKIKFASSGYLIIYPDSEVELLSLDKSLLSNQAQIKLNQGSIRIINKKDGSYKIKLDVIGSQIKLLDSYGELLITQKDNKQTIYNLQFNNDSDKGKLSKRNQFNLKDEKLETIAINDTQLETLNKTYQIPKESYFSVESLAIQKTTEPKHSIGLGINGKRFRFHPNADMGKYKIGNGGNASFYYLYNLSKNYRAGLQLYSGSVSTSVTGQKGENTEFSGFSLKLGKYMLDYFWLYLQAGSSNISISIDKPYSEVKFSGMGYGIVAEKSWNFYWKLHLLVNAGFEYYLWNKVSKSVNYNTSNQNKLSGEAFTLGLGLQISF